MIKYIPELIEAKIDSFKIEGRMKDILYVKTVASCYREAIENYKNGIFNEKKVKEWIGRLSKVYNRGFHTGFYFHRPTIEDIELDRGGNISPWRLQYIGEILSFDDISMTANVIIEKINIPLTKGSEIIIRGNDTYHIDTVKKIHLKGEKVEKIKRNQGDKPLKINIRLVIKVKSNEKIYILTKE